MADDRSIQNSRGMRFVLIPAGSFLMGSPDNEPGARPDEKPRHAVTISKPFYLGTHAVTQQQWKAVMGGSSFSLPRTYPGRWNRLISQPGRFVAVDKPATVSWRDAREFIRRLNETEGHQRYRLPTEAEWEYACRAGTTSAFSFGDDRRRLLLHAWADEDFTIGQIHSVGQKQPNAWGLYDMHGNVWEWVQDYYSSRYYTESPAIDPTGPATGSERVVRGGSWHSSSSDWRSAFRRSYPEEYRGISIGFRVLLESE